MKRVWRLVVVMTMAAGFVALSPAPPAAADGVVGTGTAGSCTEVALINALIGGGLVTFNCGPAPHTITVTGEKVISIDTQIDGGGLITISGGNTTRLFRVNAGIKLDLVGLTISNGNADTGGAIFNEGTTTITNSTLSGNTATIGGAINNNGGSAAIINSTLSGNTASLGGGIFSVAPGNPTLSLINSTLVGNSASVGGGIFGVGPYEFQNTIIADNSPTNCEGGPPASLGGNLSDDNSCSLTAAGDQPDTEPQLGPLADNGGPTLTHLPQVGSPAIDNGLLAGCPATDQRGIARPQGAGCDIGAVEVRTGATYPLCVNRYTGAVTSPLSGDCTGGTIEIEPFNQSFCLDRYTGQVLYLFGRPCNPPRIPHTMPDDGDLLTCVSYYTGANRWVASHSQCKANEVRNTIPATR